MSTIYTHETLLEKTNYFLDLENYCLSKWDNLKFPIQQYHSSKLWDSLIESYLDVPSINNINMYRQWRYLNLSEDWFYDYRPRSHLL